MSADPSTADASALNSEECKRTMATTSRRQGDPGQNFEQVTEGELTSSVEVSLNAKGQAQWSIKLYYPDPAAMIDRSGDELELVARGIHAALTALGIPLTATTAATATQTAGGQR
jgi:hypothetical protein